MNEAEFELKDALTVDYGRTLKEYYEDGEAPDYCVLHMSVLEDLPDDTQKRFVAILEEIHNTFDMSEVPSDYQVVIRTEKGQFNRDPYIDKTPPKFRK